MKTPRGRDVRDGEVWRLSKRQEDEKAKNMSERQGERRAGAGQEADGGWRCQRCQKLLHRSRGLTKETLNLVTQTSLVTLQESSCGVTGGGGRAHSAGRREEGTQCAEDFCFVLKGR